MNDEDHKRGNSILALLNGFSLEPLIDEIRVLYDSAYNMMNRNPKNAIKHCEKALEVLEDLPQETLPDAKKLGASKAKCHLLLASIYLNEETELEKAEKHYVHSKDEFGRKTQWSHFESLAYLGLAITRRKLRRTKEANEACEDAQAKSIAESIPSETDTKALRDAIKQERERIQQIIQKEKIPPSYKQTPSPDKLRELPVFDIAVGKDIIEEYPTTKLCLLSLKEYKKHQPAPKHETFDLSNFPEAKEATYVLEVGQVDQTDGGLQKGDYIFIKQEVNSTKLENKPVGVLVITRPGVTCATLKIFCKYDDHYLLRGVRPGDRPIIATSYDTKETVARYYREYVRFSRKFVYEIAVSGEVIVAIRKNDPYNSFLRVF